jgi:hypothetical protein
MYISGSSRACATYNCMIDICENISIRLNKNRLKTEENISHIKYDLITKLRHALLAYNRLLNVTAF